MRTYKVKIAESVLLAAGLFMATTSNAMATQSTVLKWAFPYSAAAAEDNALVAEKLYSVPGSDLQFNGRRVADVFNPPDWKPSEHAPAPTVVLRGRKPDVMACGTCHLINGQGGAGAASLAGLSRQYITRQIDAFKHGERVTTHPERPAPKDMAGVARKATRADIRRAAAYYESIRYQPWIRVAEVSEVPQTRATFYGWLELLPNGGAELIGNRIIEVAEDRIRTELYDPNSGFVAYVPIGSVSRGEKLVKIREELGLPCEGCHGAGLKGNAQGPPLAGRSPSYLARQLWDFKQKGRRGAGAAIMTEQAKTLTESDIVDITAYLASLTP